MARCFFRKRSGWNVRTVDPASRTELLQQGRLWSYPCRSVPLEHCPQLHHLISSTLLSLCSPKVHNDIELDIQLAMETRDEKKIQDARAGHKRKALQYLSTKSLEPATGSDKPKVEYHKKVKAWLVGTNKQLQVSRGGVGALSAAGGPVSARTSRVLAHNHLVCGPGGRRLVSGTIPSQCCPCGGHGHEGSLAQAVERRSAVHR